MEISHGDNHGMVQVLETHCNYCKWAIGPEGELRNQGYQKVEGRIPKRGKER